MRKLVLGATALMAAITITGSIQAQSQTTTTNEVASRQRVATASPNATRARTLGSVVLASGGDSTTEPLHPQVPVEMSGLKKGGRSRSTNVAGQNKSSQPNSAGSSLAPAGNQPEVPGKALPAPNSVSSPAVVTIASSQVYRVGIRDVLDIRITNNPSNESTLFTVLDGGLLDYPFAGNPIAVAGMTTTEIANMLRLRIKIFDDPKVVVTVRDFASHTVNVSGFVASPGKKSLRREAMPLYAVLAEALVLPEAGRATITRPGRPAMTVDLKDPNLSATLVLPGDAIKVLGSPSAPTEFFFIGGRVNSPGQKAFHVGLTLTQAILASGGTKARTAAQVRISRQGADGRLVREVYNLRSIQDGKSADPGLQKGDRIEVFD